MINDYYYKKISILLNKILIVSLISISILMPASKAENHNEVKVGILLGFNGVVESLTSSMADSAELAFDEISEDKELTKKIRFKIQRAKHHRHQSRRLFL